MTLLPSYKTALKRWSSLCPSLNVRSAHGCLHCLKSLVMLTFMCIPLPRPNSPLSKPGGDCVLFVWFLAVFSPFPSVFSCVFVCGRGCGWLVAATGQGTPASNPSNHPPPYKPGRLITSTPDYSVQYGSKGLAGYSRPFVFLDVR